MIIKIAISMLAVYLLGFYTNAAIEAEARREKQQQADRAERCRIHRARRRELHRLSLNREVVSHVDA